MAVCIAAVAQFNRVPGADRPTMGVANTTAQGYGDFTTLTGIPNAYDGTTNTIETTTCMAITENCSYYGSKQGRVTFSGFKNTTQRAGTLYVNFACGGNTSYNVAVFEYSTNGGANWTQFWGGTAHAQGNASVALNIAPSTLMVRVTVWAQDAFGSGNKSTWLNLYDILFI